MATSRKPMDTGDELALISAEVERAIVRRLEQYAREFETIRDRESLVPAKGGE